tara:strand:- start:1235 stop:1501 length:267 start_codon:yes stop_codon:yes gene_type:complete
MQTEEDFTGPLNLDNSQECTIKVLAEKIISLTNSQSKIIMKSLPMDNPVKRKPDITMVKKKFDWSPKVDLEEGLIKTTNYFEKIKRLS